MGQQNHGIFTMEPSKVEPKIASEIKKMLLSPGGHGLGHLVISWWIHGDLMVISW